MSGKVLLACSPLGEFSQCWRVYWYEKRESGNAVLRTACKTAVLGRGDHWDVWKSDKSHSDDIVACEPIIIVHLNQQSCPFDRTMPVFNRAGKSRATGISILTTNLKKNLITSVHAS